MFANQILESPTCIGSIPQECATGLTSRVVQVLHLIQGLEFEKTGGGALPIRWFYFSLGVRDAGLLERDGLPLAALFHIDTREHVLAGGIVSRQGSFYVGLAGDYGRIAIYAHLQIGNVVSREFALAGFECVYHLRLVGHLAVHVDEAVVVRCLLLERCNVTFDDRSGAIHLKFLDLFLNIFSSGGAEQRYCGERCGE